MSKTTYTVEVIPANELLVDRRVQRDELNQRKVEKIFSDFNDDALGVVHVSRRKDRGLYIIDGWHRDEAAKRKDPAYPLTCHVFEGLTLVQEAEMFLDLNFSTQPSLLEKFKVRLSAEDPDSVLIDKITRDRGWKVDPNPGSGSIQAIGALYRINEMSKRVNAEPHLLDAVLLIVTRAWGDDRAGSQAVILEGLARVIAKHGDKEGVIPRLWEQLRDRSGGVSALHTEATQIAKMRRGHVTTAVAELIVETFNKNARSKSLPRWGER